MKKIISVLILLASVMMLSSCFWVINDDDTTNYYDITCYNDSDTLITDWCVVRNGKRTFAKDEYKVCSIDPNKSATLYNLPEGDYVLYVSFFPDPDYENGDYVESRKFKLNKNISVHIDDTYVPN